MHLVGIIYQNIITMHGPMNVKYMYQVIASFCQIIHGYMFRLCEPFINVDTGDLYTALRTKSFLSH